MPRKNYLQETEEVKRRFIRSFEELRYRGLVKTKREFCQAVGLGVSANMSRMEREGREPSVTNILLLHKKFNVSIEWIMLGEGEFII